MTIWKFPIELADVQEVKMPLRSKLLTAQMQDGRLCLWAMVDERTTDLEARTIEIFGTGHPMSEGERRYIGTVLMDEGSFVWHVFERNPESNGQSLGSSKIATK